MNTWTLTWSGLRTVTELELKQRIRSKRWFIALVGWFLMLGIITGLVMLAAAWADPAPQDPSVYHQGPGPMAFAAITYLVLGMGLVIAPAFTATAINGDRAGGTLATLQATRLSALEIAAGKLAAAWLTAIVFLAVALPYIGWSMVLGGISVVQVLAVFLVVVIEVAVVCAIGLGWSALISRPAGSAMLTYLSVVFLSVVTLIVYSLGQVLVVDKETVRIWGLSPIVERAYNQQLDEYYQENPAGDDPPPAPVEKCSWYEEKQSITHTEKVWWLLLANPFVIVSDAAPLPAAADNDLAGYAAQATDPMANIRYQVRRLSVPPSHELDRCSSYYDSQPGYSVTYVNSEVVVTTSNGTPVKVSPVKSEVVNTDTPVWPWGLGAQLLLGGAFFVIAVRRLKIPYRRLPSGTRVA